MFLLMLLNLFFKPLDPRKTADNIVVEINNIDFKKGGTIYLEILDASNKSILKLKQPIKQNQNSFVFNNLPFGKYAVRAYHDENNNGKLDTGLFGQPIEGWGVSNDARGFMCAPSFTKMLFTHNAATKISFKFSY